MAQSSQITDAEHAEFVQRQAERYGMCFVVKDGPCFKCQRDAIAHHVKSGNDGSKEAVTGCPFCYRTFCDERRSRSNVGVLSLDTIELRSSSLLTETFAKTKTA